MEQSKELNIILKVSKVFRIIYKIAFILLIIGLVGVIIGLATFGSLKDMNINGSTFAQEIVKETGMTYDDCMIAMVIGLIACVGGIPELIFGKIYFETTLRNNTPFTMEGVKNLQRFAIVTIVVPIVVSVISAIILSVYIQKSGSTADLDYDGGVNVATGLFLLFLSVVYKYVAKKELDNKTQEPEL